MGGIRTHNRPGAASEGETTAAVHRRGGRGGRRRARIHEARGFPAAEGVPPAPGERFDDAAVAAGVVRGGALARELLEGVALGLGDEEGDEEAGEHKEGEDLHQPVDPGGAGEPLAVRRRALLHQRDRDDLGQDGADLAHGGGDAVGRRPVARRVALAGDDEGRRVGAEVEEVVGDHVEREQGPLVQPVVAEPEHAEDDGEDGEAEDLQRLAADGVDEEDRRPVAWEGARHDEDDGADGVVAEDVV